MHMSCLHHVTRVVWFYHTCTWEGLANFVPCFENHRKTSFDDCKQSCPYMSMFIVYFRNDSCTYRVLQLVQGYCMYIYGKTAHRCCYYTHSMVMWQASNKSILFDITHSQYDIHISICIIVCADDCIFQWTNVCR